jgi:A/G-specific adenine glycosylase
MALDEDILQRHHIEPAAKCLLEHGRNIGPFMPWQSSKDPYHWLVAEVLLRRTTRSAVQQAFYDLVESYPTWKALASASEKEIRDKVAWLGLGNQRSRHLKTMARTVTEELQTIDLCERDTLLSLPGVGRYIADVVQLHLCEKKALPIVASFQRVLRRVMGLPIPTRTASSNPYRDPWIEKAVEWITSQYSARELADIHRSILHIAWETCRPDNPRCFSCPVKRVCGYALKKHPQSQ